MGVWIFAAEALAALGGAASEEVVGVVVSEEDVGVVVSEREVGVVVSLLVKTQIVQRSGYVLSPFYKRQYHKL